MKTNLFYLLFLCAFSCLSKKSFSQTLTYNWAHNMGNNGPGALLINHSCTNNQNHYINVGKISGTIDFDPSAGYYLVNGNQYGINSRYNAFLAEYDSSGALLKALAVSPLTSRTSFEAVACDANGNYIVSGLMGDSAYLDPANPYDLTYATGTTPDQMFIAKYDPNMQLIWVKTFNHNNVALPRKLQIDQFNNIIFAGEFKFSVDFDPSALDYTLASYSGGNNYYDAFLTKFDPNGNLIWAKNLGTSLDDLVGDITLDGNNDVYIGVSYNGQTAFIDTGIVVSALGTNFIGITKFSSAGLFIWNKFISNSGGSTNLDLNDLEANPAGEVFFTGRLSGSAYFQNPGILIGSGTTSGCDFIAKLNANGNCAWAYSSFSIVSIGYSLGIDNQSNLYLTGTYTGTKDFDYKIGTVNLSSFPVTSNNIYFASYDSTGSYRWAYRVFTMGSTEIKVSASAKVWINGDFNSSVDFNTGAGTNVLSTTNATQFVSAYTSAGSYQSAFALTGSGSTKERVTSIDAKGNGTIIVAGTFTGSIDLDPSASDNIISSTLDSSAYIAAYNTAGGFLWSNKISGRAHIKALKKDNNGNIYITGYYQNAVYFDVNNQPMVYESAAGAAEDIFLVKYNSSGLMQWAHTFGSANRDMGIDLSIDHSGNVIMGGIYTTSIDFDPSAGIFNLTTPQNIESGFFAKYDSTGNFILAFRVVAASLNSVCTDNADNIIVSGNMKSFGNFDYTGPGVIVYTTGGPNDFDYYIAKYSPSAQYQWAFRIGDISANNSASDIELDNAGNIFFSAFISGSSDSLDIDPGAGTVLLPASSGVLLKYSGSGQLIWGINTAVKRKSTLAVDHHNNPTIWCEYLNNVDLDPGPATFTIPSANSSVALLRYSAVGEYLSARVYSPNSTFYKILPTSISVHDTNDVICGGYYNGEVDFNPALGTQNILFNTSNTGDEDGFLLSTTQSDYLAVFPPSAAFSVNSTAFCAGSCVNFQDNSLFAPSNWLWSFPGGNPAVSTAQNPQNICYAAAGQYDVQLIVSNTLGSDTILLNNFIVADTIPVVNAGNDVSICAGSSVQLFGSGAGSYSWSPAAGLINANTATPVASPTVTSTFTLTGAYGACTATDQVVVTVNPNPTAPVISPSGNELQSTAAFAYQWYYNGVPLSGATFQTVFPALPGNYTVTVFDTNGCFTSSSSYYVTVTDINNRISSIYDIKAGYDEANNKISIFSLGINGEAEFILFDLSGRQIFTEKTFIHAGNNSLHKDLNNLASGIYQLKVKTNEFEKVCKILR